MAHTTQESIDAFKKFVRAHPELVKGIKKDGKSWKEVFEEWVIFGEDHEIWDNYGIERQKGNKRKTGQGEPLSKLWGFIKNADFDNIGEQLDQINGALTNLSELITLFNPTQTENQSTQPFNNRGQQPFQQQPPFQQPPFQSSEQPFQFRRD